MSDPLVAFYLLASLALVLLAVLVRRYFGSRRQLRARIVELEALNRVGRALVESQLDPAALYELIFQQAGAIIDTSTFQLGLFEDGRYHIAIWMRDGERLLPAVFERSSNEGLVGWVQQKQAPLLVQDYQSEWGSLPAHPSYMSDRPPRAALFIPLITGDECIGVMAAQSYQANIFSWDDVHRLSIVANQAASAIVSARLYQQTQMRAAQLELVSRISRQVRALTPLQNLFAETVALIQRTFGYYSVSIFAYDELTGRVSLQASTVEEVDQMREQLSIDSGLINWAIQNRETVTVADVAADERFVSMGILPDTRSEMVVPLLIEERVLGALDLQSDLLNAFGPEDKFALEALADQISLAIQESQLYHAEKHQRSVAETLREVAQTLTSSLELETVLHTILTDLRRVLAYDAAAILMCEGDGRVVVQAAQGLPNVVETQGQSFDLDESERLSRLAEGTQPIIFECDDDTGCYHAVLDLPPEHACLGVPLIARGELIGFLTADALPPQVYRPADAAVLATFAGQAAVAIDNARLFAAQREDAWISNALLQLAEATTQAEELEQVLEIIAQMTVSLVGVGQCGVLLWEEERESFCGTQLAGDRMDLAEEFSQLVLPLRLWSPLQALKNRPQPILLGGGEALSALPDEMFDFFGLDNWLLLLPLLGKEGLIGVMLVSGETADVAVIRRRVQLISGIANQASMAVENARLYVAQQEEAYVTIVLLQVAEAVNSLTNLDDILTTIARLAPLLVGVEQCVILIWNPNTASFVVGSEYGFADDRWALFEQSLTEPAVEEFLAGFQLSNQPVGLGPGYSEPQLEPWQPILDDSAVLMFPLITRRELVGAMLVTLPADQAPFGNRRQNILTGIAHQASSAIETDQLYSEAVERERMERELEVAREIQSSFLPDFQPEELGWSVAAYWQAARQVGGDFYDFYRLTRNPEKQWAVVVADVADKGVPAALYMALSRTLIRSVSHNRVDPATTLERVNELLLNDSRSDLFVTVIYAVWEPDANRLFYANAGHNPPLCLRQDGSVEVMTENGIVLGILPQVDMVDQYVDLAPGEVMIFYTDGVTDAINDAEEEFGMDRLVATISASRHLPAEGIVRQIELAVAEFVGQTPQFDDLTLVVIKRELDSE